MRSEVKTTRHFEPPGKEVSGLPNLCHGNWQVRVATRIQAPGRIRWRHATEAVDSGAILRYEGAPCLTQQKTQKWAIWKWEMGHGRPGGK
jgi:hypothetical protein